MGEGFRVVLADPPWCYSQRGTRLNGTTDHHYEAMDSTEIMALPVSDIAAPDAFLLLWATWPFLPVALRVVEAWGFGYVTGLPWVKVEKIMGNDFEGRPGFKPTYGVGHWFRGCTEPLLVARRGRLPAPRTNFVGLLSENQRHSRKPDSVYSLAEALGEPRIELFARERRPGWTVVGHGVDEGADIRARLTEFARPGG